jgi:hypothetical protein
MTARQKIIQAIRWHEFEGVTEGGVTFASGFATAADAEELADEICKAIDDQPFHTVDLREDGWTLKHPLDCRHELFACPYNRALGVLDGVPESGPGVYRVDLDGHHLLLGDVLESRPS